MNVWIAGMGTTRFVLLVVVLLIALAIVTGLLTRVLVLRTLRAPFIVRLVNRAVETVVSVVSRPLTIAVLDEVTDVIRAGRYTRNISDALVENKAELKALVAEKVSADPNVRLVTKIPGYATIVDTVSDTTLRVLVEMLGDPRMDELVADLLRNNIQQIRRIGARPTARGDPVRPPGPGRAERPLNRPCLRTVGRAPAPRRPATRSTASAGPRSRRSAIRSGSSPKNARSGGGVASTTSRIAARSPRERPVTRRWRGLLRSSSYAAIGSLRLADDTAPVGGVAARLDQGHVDAELVDLLGQGLEEKPSSAHLEAW